MVLHHGKPLKNVILIRFFLKVERCLALELSNEAQLTVALLTGGRAIFVESSFETRTQFSALFELKALAAKDPTTITHSVVIIMPRYDAGPICERLTIWHDDHQPGMWRLSVFMCGCSSDLPSFHFRYRD